MKLHYKILGETGQPLIILHGLFGMNDNWQTIAKEFSVKHKVFLVDARNHGYSPHSDEMNYIVMVDDLKEIFDAEKIEHAILMGHSMGGKTAMFFAQQYPKLIDKLIIVDMGVKKYPPHHQQIFDALLAIDLAKIKSRKEAEEIVLKHYSDKVMIQFLLKNLYWDEKQNLVWRMNLDVLIREINNILVAVPNKECSVPALFIRGEKSNYVLDEDWTEIDKIFINSALETVVGAGHWVHAERGKAFFDLVTVFIL